jgi:2-polyprenyl-3-methyl-5-hydroxy-6-metoxy-1,4-benzoquinol methylase
MQRMSEDDQRTVLDDPNGSLEVVELGNGRRQVMVNPRDPTVFVQTKSCETNYPVELIDEFRRVKGIAWVCDEIARDENPQYVQLFLRYGMLTHLPEHAFAGKRLLDFGCGCGGSTMILARMFPQTEIVGVDLAGELVSLAEQRKRFSGAANVSFVVSPDSASLPAGLGMFDFISLCAVWEHLLPGERRTLVPMLWSALNETGVLFVNETPHRWYLLEAHTTGLPLLNFLPRPVAHWAANRYSKRLPDDESWEELLRNGIRGGTEREILRVLRRAGQGRPVLLKPSRLGISDRVDLWYAYSQAARPMKIKRHMRTAFKVISWLTRSTYAPGLNLAIQKQQK